MLTYFLIQLLL